MCTEGGYRPERSSGAVMPAVTQGIEASMLGVGVPLHSVWPTSR